MGEKAVHPTGGIVLLFVVLALKTTPAQSDDLACLSTTFRFLGANDKVCVSAFDDPKVPGVACHISQARTGGVKGKPRTGRRSLSLLYCLPPSGANHGRYCEVARRRVSILRTHVYLFQAYPSLPYG